MVNKTKILFVVSEFYQAGTQRFTYELDQALNKELFSVEILCLLPLNSSDRFSDYYYKKHLELGTKIYFIEQLNNPFQPSLKQKIKKRFLNKSYPDKQSIIESFFGNYDCISIMGEYNLKEIHRFILPSNKNKLLIHIQNSKYQVPDAYVAFPKNEIFHFVSGFHKGQIEFELSEFKDYRHTYYNLNFKFDNSFTKTSYNSSDSPKIGIFTRLTPAKPLDPFLYTFQLITERILGAELHIYGSGDPIKEGVSRVIDQLALNNKIIFRGHQENILKTAFEDNLDLVWLHGYHGLPGGWAGFDICTGRFPQLFWNFGKTEHSKDYSFFPMFNSITAFAEKSLELINNPELAIKIAAEQFEYTNEHYNIQKNIVVMEELYQSIKKQNNKE
jgi:glycosyltransferase involved in cell wall biosynthesis